MTLDGLTLFGLFAVSAMLVFYALEPRGRIYILGFAIACGLGSAYGFLRAPGHSGLWKRSGRGLRCGGILSQGTAEGQRFTSR